MCSDGARAISAETHSLSGTLRNTTEGSDLAWGSGSANGTLNLPVIRPNGWIFTNRPTKLVMVVVRPTQLNIELGTHVQRSLSETDPAWTAPSELHRAADDWASTEKCRNAWRSTCCIYVSLFRVIWARRMWECVCIYVCVCFPRWPNCNWWASGARADEKRMMIMMNFAH